MKREDDIQTVLLIENIDELMQAGTLVQIQTRFATIGRIITKMKRVKSEGKVISGSESLMLKSFEEDYTRLKRYLDHKTKVGAKKYGTAT